MAAVDDVNLNKYATDATTYPNAAKQVIGYAKGKRILVTYYRTLKQGSVNIRSNLTDMPGPMGNLNKEYQKIINLEITLPKGFDFESNPEKASIGVTGQAFFYPYMNPNVGDVFTMGIGDGRTGVFQVSGVNRTSWRQDGIFLVNFVLQDFLSPNGADPINGAVTITSVFSKANYLGGTAALLSEQTYLQLQKMTAVRSSLCKYYHQKFFDSNRSSYFHPEGYYDPFVVYFMANKLTMDDIHVRPKLLIPQNPKLYKQTIWSRLEDRYNTSLYGLYPEYTLEIYRQNRMSVFLTELNRCKIVVPSGEITGFTPIADSDESVLVDDDTDQLVDVAQSTPNPSYVFSLAFYANLRSGMPIYEEMVYDAVTLRTVENLSSFITNYLDLVYYLSDAEQFYRIPVYIHLIDMAQQYQYREIDAPSMNYSSTGA